MQSLNHLDELERDLLHETKKLEKWAKRVTRRIWRLNAVIQLVDDKKRSLGVPAKIKAKQIDMFGGF